MPNLMTWVERYAAAMKLAERYGNKHGDMDAANAAWSECKKFQDENDKMREAFTVLWKSDDRAAWDAKAVEHFDAILGKIKP